MRASRRLVPGQGGVVIAHRSAITMTTKVQGIKYRLWESTEVLSVAIGIIEVKIAHGSAITKTTNVQGAKYKP